jgi:hypothetical protein
MPGTAGMKERGEVRMAMDAFAASARTTGTPPPREERGPEALVSRCYARAGETATGRPERKTGSDPVFRVANGKRRTENGV